MTECKKPIEFALHDLPYLLIHTVSQLWDKHENISKLVRLGLLTAMQSMYNHLSSFLLSAKMDPSTENRFPEFLSLLSTLVLIAIFLLISQAEEPSNSQSPIRWNSTLNSLQELFLPLLLRDLTTSTTSVSTTFAQLILHFSYCFNT